MDAEAIISKYIEIRNYIKAQDEAHDQRMKAYKDGLRTLEGAAALLARQTGQSALKAVSGTAFPVTQTRVKCTDRDAFLDFVFNANAREFLTAHIAKEAVKQFMETNEGQVPPGVGVDTEIKWEFRRA